jgi:hypothetical protein
VICADFLTFMIGLQSVCAFMRRRLKISTTYAPTRSSCEHLEFAYEVLVCSSHQERERTEVALDGDRDERMTVQSKRASR